MVEAKYAKIRDPMNRGIFRDALGTELPYDVNLITPRYFFALKSDEDKGERFKARYVVGVHFDTVRKYLMQ